VSKREKESQTAKERGRRGEIEGKGGIERGRIGRR
jgi:hypothetical protein